MSDLRRGRSGTKLYFLLVPAKVNIVHATFFLHTLGIFFLDVRCTSVVVAAAVGAAAANSAATAAVASRRTGIPSMLYTLL